MFADSGKDLKLKADISLKGMNIMGYDAMNLGSHEFYFGADYLDSASHDIIFPFISSNLAYRTGRPSWVKEYMIKNIDGIKVAVLGILPADAFEKNRLQDLKDLKIIPPETALKKILPEVRKKADVVVLLSQYGFESTTSLLKSLAGIDLAISCGVGKLFPQDKNVPVMQTDLKGEEIGLIQVTRSESGKISIGQIEFVKSDDSVPDHDGMKNIYTKAHFLESRENSLKKLRQELKDGLELTPMEFIEQYQKDQSGNKGDLK